MWRLLGIIICSISFSHSELFALTNISQLAKELGLTIHASYDGENAPMPQKNETATSSSVMALEGSWFTYLPSTTGAGVGLLVPTRDLSRQTTDTSFMPIIRRDSVPDDVANSIRMKVFQLRRLEPYGGPKVIGLGVRIERAGKKIIRDLVLRVEHLDGTFVDADPAKRSEAELAEMSDLLIQLSSDGWSPLDFRRENVLKSTGRKKMVPFDVILTTPDEVNILENAPDGSPQKRLWRLRMLEAAYTEKRIESALPYLNGHADACAKIAANLLKQFPRSIEFHRYVK